MNPQNSSPKVGREKILEVSEKLFTEHGYRAVSIRDIANACNVTNAALYYHFKNKDDLFEKVLERHGERLKEKMLNAADMADTNQAKVMAMLVVYADLIDKRHSSGLSMRHKTSGLSHEKLRKQRGHFMQSMLMPLEQSIQSAIDAGELKPVPKDTSAASILLGMLHGLHQHRRMCFDSKISHEQIRFVVDIFWKGLGNE